MSLSYLSFLVSIVEVVRLDLQLGTSQSLFCRQTIDTVNPMPFNNAALCGDFAACILDSEQIILINWRVDLWIILGGPESVCEVQILVYL